MINRLTTLIALAILTSCASSALAESMEATRMAERYLDIQHCMERTLGKQWPEKYGIELARNRWGVIEATERSINTAPQAVRMTDLRCRRQISLTGEPRP